MPIPLCRQSVSLVSVPAQVTLLRRTDLAVVSFTENDCVTSGAVEKEVCNSCDLMELSETKLASIGCAIYN